MQANGPPPGSGGAASRRRPSLEREGVRRAAASTALPVDRADQVRCPRGRTAGPGRWRKPRERRASLQPVSRWSPRSTEESGGPSLPPHPSSARHVSLPGSEAGASGGPPPPPRRGTACSARRRRVGTRPRGRPTPCAAVAWPAVGCTRPVLKHGPRSATGARVSG